MVIVNTNTIKSTEAVQVFDVLSGSPDITISFPENTTLPLSLSPKQKLTVNIIVTAQNLGNFESLVYVLLEERVFVQTLIGNVVPNSFGLSPIYYPDLLNKEEVNHPLVIANPYAKQIFVEEFYLTNDRFKAEFKKAGSYSKLNKPNFIIEANSNRTFCTIYFRAEILQDVDNMGLSPEIDETEIVVRFSSGEFFRIPLVVRIRADLVATSPSLVDFGLVQLNQKPLKIDLYARFDTKKVRKVEDYFLPLDQPNLDFSINRPPADLAQEQAKDKQGGRIFIGTVFLYAVKAQFVTSTIKVKLQTFEDLHDPDLDAEECPERNNTIFVDIPIIASVVNHTNFLSSIDAKMKGVDFLQAIAPIQRFDIYSTTQQVPVNGYQQSDTSEPISFPMIIKNSLSQPFTVNKILDQERLPSLTSQELKAWFVKTEHLADQTKLLMKTGQFEQ
jgi:hypothetical protein